jgi:hypothetical protein
MIEIKPGPELDWAVAEAVGAKPRIGKDRRSVVVAIEDGRIMRHLAIPTDPDAACNGAFVPFSPSTDLNAAFQAAESIGLFDYEIPPGYRLSLFRSDANTWSVSRPGMIADAFTPALALAICAAILKLKEIDHGT